MNKQIDDTQFALLFQVSPEGMVILEPILAKEGIYVEEVEEKMKELLVGLGQIALTDPDLPIRYLQEFRKEFGSENLIFIEPEGQA